MAVRADSSLPALTYKPLSTASRGAFSCGVAEIDAWFRKCDDLHAKFRHRVTTVHAGGDDSLAGFYALSIKLESARMLTSLEKASWRLAFNTSGPDFVCLNLDYLAVRKDLQRRRIGTVILGRIIEEFALIARTCGVQIMTGSARSRKILDFYEALGFRQYGHATLMPQIYLSALSAIEVVAAAD